MFDSIVDAEKQAWSLMTEAQRGFKKSVALGFTLALAFVALVGGHLYYKARQIESQRTEVNGSRTREPKNRSPVHPSAAANVSSSGSNNSFYREFIDQVNQRRRAPVQITKPYQLKKLPRRN